MLFVDADLGGLAEPDDRRRFGGPMNCFYATATDVLIRTDAVIDKLVGDEVIGLYLPIFTGADHARPAVQAAGEFLAATGHATRPVRGCPWGSACTRGRAFVGTVSGAEGSVSDITALGDNVNVTARRHRSPRPARR